MQYSVSLDLAPTWASIDQAMADEFPGITIRPNGMMDDDAVPKYESGLIKPYIIVWHLQLRRGNARSYGGTRLDDYGSGLDLSIIANNGTDAMEVASQVADFLIGFKPLGGGAMVKGRGLFDGSRAVTSSETKPTRFATSDRFNYSWSAQPVPITP